MFSLFDESAIKMAGLHPDRHEFVFSENAINTRSKNEVLADMSCIPDRGHYGLPSLHYGSASWVVVKDRY